MEREMVDQDDQTTGVQTGEESQPAGAPEQPQDEPLTSDEPQESSE